MRKGIQRRGYTEATTSCTRSCQWRQRPLSLSLSLCHYTHALYNYLQKCNNKNMQNVCPKSYLYIYDFRVIYTYGPKGLTGTYLHICVPSNRSDGSPLGLRSPGSPKLPIRRDLFPNNYKEHGKAPINEMEFQDDERYYPSQRIERYRNSKDVFKNTIGS